MYIIIKLNRMRENTRVALREMETTKKKIKRRKQERRKAESGDQLLADCQPNED